MTDPETEDCDYYMVRAKDQTDEEFGFFFDNEIVAIGWSRVDVRELIRKRRWTRSWVSTTTFGTKPVPDCGGGERTESFGSGEGEIPARRWGHCRHPSR